MRPAALPPAFLFPPPAMTALAGPDLGDAPSDLVVDVLAPVAVDTAYSYRAPSDWKLEPGTCVRVPLGARQATGVVWATRPAGGDNLKSVAAVLDWPPLRAALRDFIDWAARWTLAPRGMLLRMAIRAGEVAEPPAPKFGVLATGKAPARMTDARARVLAALANAGGAEAQGDGRGDRGVLDQRDRRPRRRWRAGKPRAYARADRGAARPRFLPGPAERGSACGGRRSRGARRRPGFFGDHARGGDGVRQDRGLFRGGRGSAAPGAPRARAPAGNRADRAIPRPLRGAFRR